MTRLFVPPEHLGEGAAITLTGEGHHYLYRVLRRRAGDEVTLLDGTGRTASARVVRAGELATELRVERVDAAPAPQPGRPTVHLLQGLLKGDRLDWVIEKATELGVATIAPLTCARSVPRPARDRGGRALRWERIAEAAARQSGRLTVPAIAEPRGLAEAVQGLHGLCLLPFEGARDTPILSVMPTPLPTTITLLVGPEGGFTLEEVELAGGAGFVPCGLGPRILRAETAALCALSIIGAALDREGRLRPRGAP